MQHAARIVVDDQPERGELVAQRQHFVHLLLVFGHDDRDLGVVPDVSQLARDRVLEDGDGDAAQGLGGHLRPVEPWPVVTDHRQLLAAPEAERGQAEGEVADMTEVLPPRVGLPDAAILLADGGTVAQLLGVAL
jgi:hypothetical protein